MAGEVSFNYWDHVWCVVGWAALPASAGQHAVIKLPRTSSDSLIWLPPGAAATLSTGELTVSRGLTNV